MTRKVAQIDRELKAAQKVVVKLYQERKAAVTESYDLTKLIKVGDVFVSKSDRYYFAVVLAVTPTIVDMQGVYVSGRQMSKYQTYKATYNHFVFLSPQTGGWKKSTKATLFKHIDRHIETAEKTAKMLKKIANNAAAGKVTK